MRVLANLPIPVMFFLFLSGVATQDQIMVCGVPRTTILRYSAGCFDCWVYRVPLAKPSRISPDTETLQYCNKVIWWRTRQLTTDCYPSALGADILN